VHLLGKGTLREESTAKARSVYSPSGLLAQRTSWASQNGGKARLLRGESDGYVTAYDLRTGRDSLKDSKRRTSICSIRASPESATAKLGE
jgi:hypothetical protein